MSECENLVTVEVFVNGEKASVCVVGGNEYVLAEKGSSVKVVVKDPSHVLTGVVVRNESSREVFRFDEDGVNIYESHFFFKGDYLAIVMSSKTWDTSRDVYFAGSERAKSAVPIGYDLEVQFPCDSVQQASGICMDYYGVDQVAEWRAKSFLESLPDDVNERALAESRAMIDRTLPRSNFFDRQEREFWANPVIRYYDEEKLAGRKAMFPPPRIEVVIEGDPAAVGDKESHDDSSDAVSLWKKYHFND